MKKEFKKTALFIIILIFIILTAVVVKQNEFYHIYYSILPSREKIQTAISRGDIKKVKRLLDSEPGIANCDIGQGITPLHLSVFENNLEIINTNSLPIFL